MRYYSSTAVEMALTGSVNEIVTTLVVDTVLGLPTQAPFTLAVDIGLSTEEIVTVTSVSGMNLTVTRGVDGTAAVAHTIGAVTRHMVTARDLREPQEHLAATANVHGIGATASVVGTDTAQALTNKTVNFANNTILGVPQASVTNLVDDLAALVQADIDASAAIEALPPFAEYVTMATCAADGSFSGTFPAGLFTVIPVLQCTVQSNTQFVFASAAATSETAFSGFCAYFSGTPKVFRLTAGFIISIHAVQMTATTASN